MYIVLRFLWLYYVHCFTFSVTLSCTAHCFMFFVTLSCTLLNVFCHSTMNIVLYFFYVSFGRYTHIYSTHVYIYMNKYIYKYIHIYISVETASLQWGNPMATSNVCWQPLSNLLRNREVTFCFKKKRPFLRLAKRVVFWNKGNTQRHWSKRSNKYIPCLYDILIYFIWGPTYENLTSLFHLFFHFDNMC